MGTKRSASHDKLVDMESDSDLRNQERQFCQIGIQIQWTDEPSSTGRPGRALHRAMLRLLRGGRTAGLGARAATANEQEVVTRVGTTRINSSQPSTRVSYVMGLNSVCYEA